jgi:hypothetical protein
MAGPPGSIFYSANMSFPEGSEDPMAYLRTPVVQAFGNPLPVESQDRNHGKGFAPHVSMQRV